MLDAAVAELASSGYAGFRMDAVTSAAVVNKTTIYRRWPCRKVLVAAAVEKLRTQFRERPLPDSGGLEGDLVAAFVLRNDFGDGVEGRAWTRLLAEHAHPDVSAIVGETVSERQAEWVSMVTRAIDRGELPPQTKPQLVLDLVRAIVDDRLRSRTCMSTSAWIAVAVQTVLAGARAGTLV